MISMSTIMMQGKLCCTRVSQSMISSSPSGRSTSNTIRTMTVLSKQSAEEYKKQNYSERMVKEYPNRPMSPHVTIYAFPTTALTSITNRITGVSLSLGAAGLASMELVYGSGTAVSVLQDVVSMGPIIATSVKFTVVFPFVYHYFGGLRHLIWDKNPNLLNNVDVLNASYGLIGSSLFLSLAISVM